MFLALAVTGAAAVASTAGAVQAKTDATQALNCARTTFAIPVLTPYTGPAAFLGQDQGSWAQLAVKQVAPKLGLKARIVAGDTTLDPAVAATAVQKALANKNVVAAVGPATSGAAGSTSPAFFAARVAAVSPSATNSALTKGASPTATKAFFRVVADDSVQGTLGAKYIAEKLNAKKVAVFDAQEPYSQGLANIAEAYLKKRGVSVQRFSVTNTTTDFSAIVNRIDRDTDVVYTPFQVAANAQNIAVTLREQGKSAVVFGTDGTSDPAFKFPGSYLTNFAPDISADNSKKSLVDAWKKANPGRTFSAFGPPAYGATEVILRAIKLACTQKKGSINRVDVLRNIKKVRIADWVLGGSFRWSTKTNDPLNGAFWLYKINSSGQQEQVAKLG
jgi:branched-chain amino acid transport system substrate-binding protein